MNQPINICISPQHDSGITADVEQNQSKEKTKGRVYILNYCQSWLLKVLNVTAEFNLAFLPLILEYLF